MRKTILLAFLCLCCLMGTALAARAPKQAPGVLPEDFGCKGIMLGAGADNLEKVFGKPLYDNDRSVFGRRIKYYTFKHGYVFGVDMDGIVADIIINDHDYTARDGVRYGATPAKIRRVYGQTERQLIGGQIMYIFESQDKSYWRFILIMDAETNSLQSFRITELPITDEEGELRRTEGEEWESNELNAVMMRNRDIDMSALKNRGQSKK